MLKYSITYLAYEVRTSDPSKIKSSFPSFTALLYISLNCSMLFTVIIELNYSVKNFVQCIFNAITDFTSFQLTINQLFCMG